MGIRGYPTLVFFHEGREVETYMNHRTLELLTSFVENTVETVRKGAKKEDISEQASDSMDYDVVDQPGEVYELTSKTFHKVLTKPGFLFVKFYAPWCSHCKDMADTWVDLARRLGHRKNVRIGNVDCMANSELCMNQHVSGYPTLLLYKNGLKINDYAGERDLGSMHSFVAGYLGEHDDL
jgi:thioredoxin domain-containing protein 5